MRCCRSWGILISKGVRNLRCPKDHRNTITADKKQNNKQLNNKRNEKVIFDVDALCTNDIVRTEVCAD